MNKLLKLCALAAFCLPTIAKADNYFPFSNLISFGDSLTDVGNGQNTPETTPPGTLWTNFLAADLGLGPVTPSQNGGQDYAYSGAITGSLNYDTTGDHTIQSQVDAYLSSTHGQANPRALYTIWGGANDIEGGIAYAASQESNPNFNANQFGLQLINDSTGNILHMVTQLHDAGAKYILVPNLPILGNTPVLSQTGYAYPRIYSIVITDVTQQIYTALSGLGVTQAQAQTIAKFISQTNQPSEADIAAFLSAGGYVPSGAVAFVAAALFQAEAGITSAIAQATEELAASGTALSSSFNTALLAKLNATGFNIIQVDIAGLMNALQQNYQKFGFLGPYSSYERFEMDANGNMITYINPGSPTQYIFFDGYHPSSETDLIGSEYFMSVLEGPSFAGILAEAPLSVMDSQNQQIQTELLGIQTGMINSLPCRWRVFASGAYGKVNQDQMTVLQKGYDQQNKSFMVGADYRFNENGIWGVAVGRSMGNVDFDNNFGGFNIDENIVNVFAGYQFLQNNFGNAYVNGALGYGVIDYSNAHRNFMLGIVPEKVTGETTGDHYAADVNVGYNFKLSDQNLKTGPLVTVDYQHVTVNPYAEVSNNFQTANGAFDALQYGKQQLDSLVGGAGWQLSYATQINTTKVLPFIQATYNHQFMDTTNNVEAGVTTLPGSMFTMPVSYPDKDFGLVNAGVQGLFQNGLALTFSFGATVGASDVGSQTYMINASVPL